MTLKLRKEIADNVEIQKVIIKELYESLGGTMAALGPDAYWYFSNAITKKWEGTPERENETFKALVINMRRMIEMWMDKTPEKFAEVFQQIATLYETPSFPKATRATLAGFVEMCFEGDVKPLSEAEKNQGYYKKVKEFLLTDFKKLAQDEFHAAAAVRKVAMAAKSLVEKCEPPKSKFKYYS